VQLCYGVTSRPHTALVADEQLPSRDCHVLAGSTGAENQLVKNCLRRHGGAWCSWHRSGQARLRRLCNPKIGDGFALKSGWTRFHLDSPRAGCCLEADPRGGCRSWRCSACSWRGKGRETRSVGGGIAAQTPEPGMFWAGRRIAIAAGRKLLEDQRLIGQHLGSAIVR